MNWYPWLNGPYRQLIGQYADGRGHHALLLHAAAGNGDDALAYGLSRWLICQQRNGEKKLRRVPQLPADAGGESPGLSRAGAGKGQEQPGYRTDPPGD